MSTKESGPELERKIHVDGNLRAVFDDMQRYVNAVKRGETPQSGPLIILGGGAVGAFASTIGALFALEHMGYKNGAGAANVVGNSVGAITATMWMNGSLKNFFKDCLKKWQNGSLITGNFKTEGNILDLYNMWLALDNDSRLQIDVPRLQANPTGLYCLLTRITDGEQVLENVKAVPSPSRTIIDGSSLPGLYDPELSPGWLENPENKPPEYTDGTLSGALPLRKLIEKFKPTSVLIISGTAKTPARLDSVLGRRLVRALGTPEMKKVKESAKGSAGEAEAELAALPGFENSGGKYAVVWPSGKVGLAEKDSVPIITEIAEVFSFILKEMGLPPGVIPMD